MTVDLYEDNLNISGLVAQKQTIGVANNVSDGYNLYQQPVDGILGLGFRETSQFNATPVFQSMIEQGKVDQPMFSIKLDDEAGSELLLGGVNKKLYKEPLFYSPIVARVRYLVADRPTYFSQLCRETGKLKWDLLPSMGKKY